MCGSADVERLKNFFDQIKPSRTDATTRLERFFVDMKRLELRTEGTSLSLPSLAVDLGALRAFFEALHLHAPRLDHLTEAVNVWRVAGLKRDEIRNAAVLGWVLDARQGHGYGSRVLSALLSRLRRRQKGSFPVPAAVDGPYSVARECYSFGDMLNRVDLMIDTQDSVIVIEVKISAAERPNQIRDYLRVACHRAINLGKANNCVIYLTPGGISAGVIDPHLILCGWKDVAHAIHSVIERDERASFNGRTLSQLAAHFHQL